MILEYSCLPSPLVSFASTEQERNFFLRDLWLLGGGVCEEQAASTRFEALNCSRRGSNCLTRRFFGYNLLGTQESGDSWDPILVGR